MVQNQLMDRLNQIQDEYKILLLKIEDSLTRNPDYVENILDSVLIFWKKHETLVDIFLNYQLESYSAHLYTAADYLDIDGLEHYPFLAQGKIHIMDDPLAKMCDTTLRLSSDEKINTQAMIEHVSFLISDNIKLLELEERPIWLLPVRENNRTEGSSEINSLAEQLFLNLFTDIESIEVYMKTCITIVDIKNHLRPELLDGILLLNEDVKEDTFEKRMEGLISYSSKVPHLRHFCEVKDYKSVFLLSIIGYLIQAIDIFLLSEEYKIIPYIRSKSAFYYYSSLCYQHLENEISADKMLFKHAIYCHLIYLAFDRSIVEKISLKQYLDIISTLDINLDLIEMMDLKDIKKVVDNNLATLYSKINEEAN